jgi:hypothetical protein
MPRAARMHNDILAWGRRINSSMFVMIAELPYKKRILGPADAAAGPASTAGAADDAAKPGRPEPVLAVRSR